jgi:hypothetical protein
MHIRTTDSSRNLPSARRPRAVVPELTSLSLEAQYLTAIKGELRGREVDYGERFEHSLGTEHLAVA